MRKVFTALLGSFLFVGGVVAGAQAGSLQNARAQASELHIQAIADYRTGNLPGAIEKFEEALVLRPGYPSFILNLALLNAAADEAEQVKFYLGRIAEMGLTAAIGDEFTVLAGDPEFKTIAAKLEANGQPVIRSQVAFTLDQKTGLTEGIAYNPENDEFYISSISEGAIYRVRPDGQSEILAGPEDLMGWGMMGLHYDPASGVLWATTASMPQARLAPADSLGSSGVMRIDPTSGAVKGLSFQQTPDGGEHVFGDVRLGPDGSVYATDSLSPQILFAPGGDFERARPLAANDFASVQGFDFTPDGEALIVADYALGLLRVSLDSDEVMRLPTPPNVALRAIDGLYRYNGGLIAIQNGTNPKRILYIRMADDWRSVTGVEVLERAHPAYDEPTLGVVVGDDFYYIANSGWPLFGDGIQADDVLAETLKPVTVLKLDLRGIN